MSKNELAYYINTLISLLELSRQKVYEVITKTDCLKVRKG